jgi:signal transduction histidine kinase
MRLSRLAWSGAKALPRHQRGAREALLCRQVANGRANAGSLTDKLVETKRLLESAVESVRIAREFAERASRLKAEFLAVVAHELRTPITSLHLQLQGLERHSDGLRSRDQRALAQMLRSTTRLSQLVDSAIGHAQLQGSRTPIYCESFDLSEVVTSVIEEQRSNAAHKGLVLDTTVGSDALMTGDPRLVRLVIGNLVDNAIKFTKDGRVRICVAPGTESHRVLVEDSGPGIASADLERVFEAFEFVAPMSRKHHAGVGLGLALVRDIVQGLGGSVEIKSAVGLGSKFTIELPVEAKNEGLSGLVCELRAHPLRRLAAEPSSSAIQ